jgi:hypothetical protein
MNDQADPNVTTWLGDTPGSVGIWDWADPTLPLCTPADPYPERICRAHERVPLAMGFDARPAPEPRPEPTAGDSISLEKAQVMALKITTAFEGKHPMDYQALADDFDGMGMSFGLIQWNFGKNTLGPVLKKMLDKDATAFAACFGKDTDYDTLKAALIAGDQKKELEWARALEKGNRAAWEAAFKKVGASAAFQKIQLEEAVGKYHSRSLKAIAEIREISPKLFEHVEFRSYAAIFDLCVQQGGLHESPTKDHKGHLIESHKALDKIRQRVKDERPATQIDLMKIVVTERGETAKAEWITDCESRRLGILDGAPHEATHGDKKTKRTNSQFGLIEKFGSKYVKDL